MQENSRLTSFKAQSDHPFCVVYGKSALFEEQLRELRQILQAGDRKLYLEIDMQSAKRDTWEATMVEILAQLGEAALQKIPKADESTQLQVYKRLHLLRNLQGRIQQESLEEQLVQYMDFVELVFYPILVTLWQAMPAVTLGLLHVEEILHWGRELHNFLLESLVRHFPEQHVHIVLYVKQSQKPRIFFGSGEIYAQKNIGFYCLDDDDDC